VLGAFFIGNFMFAPAEAVQQVPFDPHIYFRGQELVYSARLWTHGWDIYQPDRVVIYHYWNSVSRPAPAGMKHYKETSDDALIARKRVRHLLNAEPASDPAALIEIEKFGMGTARTLEEYWRFAGINLATGEVAEKAKKVEWTNVD
jgi:GT2 family glycosyltransferase